MTRRSLTFAAAALLTVSSQAFAQTGHEDGWPDLVTDRPDYTESSEVVGRGLFQLEGGFNYEGAGATRSVTVPGVLLRLGLGNRAELRLGTDGFLSQRAGALRVSGAADAEIGVKVRLLDQARHHFDLAILPMVSLPTGSDSESSGAVDPTVKITWARGLPTGFDLTGNVNVSSLSDESGRFAQRAVSVSLGHDLAAGWGSFLEGYAFTPMERGTGTGATIDGGVTRPVGTNLQFDVEVGRGVTTDAPDWFVGFGFAVRGRALGGRR